MEKYFICVFFSEWGKGGSTAANAINYGRTMTESVNSLKEYDQIELLLRGNMENPLDCHKAYIVIEVIFTSTAPFGTGSYTTGSRFHPCCQKSQCDLTFTSFIFANKITGIPAVMEMIK